MGPCRTTKGKNRSRAVEEGPSKSRIADILRIGHYAHGPIESDNDFFEAGIDILRMIGNADRSHFWP